MIPKVIIENCNRTQKSIAVFLCVLLAGCGVSKLEPKAAYQLRILDEYIVEDELEVGKHKIGGLSGIDFNGESYVLISDHYRKPVIYNAKIDISDKKIDSIRFFEPNIVKCDTIQALDTESIRFWPGDNSYLISGEGNIKKGLDPVILKVDQNGQCLRYFDIPVFFQAKTKDGPLQNSVFEGLSVDSQKEGFWVINELPLQRDGKKPKLYNTNAPLRLTHYDYTSGKADFQLSYDLDRLIKVPILPFGLNGATEILQIDKNNILVVERAYSAGYKSKGNRVMIFLVDISDQQNLLNVSTLKDYKSQNLEKHLLFDSKDIKKQLKHKFIDNIEGITFGPDLDNGNKSLILVSDNNFNTFGQQINQFLLLELEKL